MLLHNHDSEDGDMLVLHVNREEASQLVQVVSAALENNPDDESFSINLGHTEHIHDPNHDHGEEIAG